MENHQGPLARLANSLLPGPNANPSVRQGHPFNLTTCLCWMVHGEKPQRETEPLSRTSDGRDDR